jgi:predicted amidohydrolase YtcJ
VRPFCGSEGGLFDPPLACAAPATTTGDGRLLGRGIKIFTDGGGNTTSASLASGRPPRILFYQQQALNRLVTDAHAAGLPIAIHAAGDIGVSMALDAYEAAVRAHPRVLPRFRIEHAITLKAADIPRLRALGVVVVTQPAAVYHAGERLARAGLAGGVLIAPFRALLNAGVTLAFSSDSPCYELSPLFQLWCAVTRATSGGGRLDDGQSLTAAEALHAYTAGAARALFAPEGSGTLTPAATADFVVLSADPGGSTPSHWRDLRVEATYLAGEPANWSALGDEPHPGRAIEGW